MTLGLNDENTAIQSARNEPSEAQVEQPAIWTTNMEPDDNEQENGFSLLEFQTTVDVENNLLNSKQSDRQLIDPIVSSQEPIISDSVTELRIRSPILRTMSEDTVYFDAANEWDSEISIPTTAIESDYNSNISSNIPQQRIIEERLSLFNQKAFIPNQLEYIHADLRKQDIVLVMPSGPARDMCYLLPLTLQKHSHLITIVLVTSYASLQEKDANLSFNSDYIQSAFVSRLRVSRRGWMPSLQFRQAILDTAVVPKSMVYLLSFDDFHKCKSSIKQMHQCNRLARIVLEDAHCFSQWGTEFHFGYLKIAEKLRSMYPNTPITALTAISNERVLADIMNSLQLPEGSTRVFKRSILL
ncbi:unnamed protein product [Mucor circinelloides]